MPWQAMRLREASILLAACLVGAPLLLPARQRPRANPAPQGEAACAQAAQWAKTHSAAARLFGATSTGDGYEPKHSTWREYASQAGLEKAAEDGNLFYRASVWTLASGGLFVETEESSFSDDWRLFVNYCFRPSGAVAKIVSELRMLASHAITRQSVDCDERGREIRRRTTRHDLETGAELSTDATEGAKAYEVIALRIYARSTDLPFYPMLAR